MSVERDNVFRPYSASYKIVRQLITQSVDFLISPSHVGINNGQAIGLACSLLGKKCMDCPMPSVVKRFSRIRQEHSHRQREKTIHGDFLFWSLCDLAKQVVELF